MTAPLHWCFAASLLFVTISAAGSSRATPLSAGRVDGAVTRAEESDAGAALFEKVWSVREGLGPFVNAQSCVACHSHPRRGGTATSPDNFVLFSPEVADPSGGHAFARFELRPNRSTRVRTLPRLVSTRRPPPLFGLGLLEAVPTSRAPGRFGIKGRFRNIDEAVAAAFANELGLLAPQFGPNAQGEISGADVRRVAQFIRLLPAPRPSASVPEGRRAFDAIGCAGCHTPVLRTGASDIASLRNQTIQPYTDLQLHDLGPALGEGWDDGNARATEFRTAPLWGLTAGGPPYLHDGRAATLEMAIETHGGEATGSAAAFRRLPASERQHLLRFLRSL